MKNLNGFVECVDCYLWADIPQGFKEIFHFAKCPKCGNAMFLVRGVSPQEVGLKDSAKTVVGLMKHGERL